MATSRRCSWNLDPRSLKCVLKHSLTFPEGIHYEGIQVHELDHLLFGMSRITWQVND